MNRWALLCAAIASEVSATLSLRAMDGWEHPWWIAVVIAGYGGSFVILAALLKSGLAVGVVYGIWAATGVALTAVLGSALFGDPFTAMMGLGIVLVVAGVLLVETGSHSHKTSRTTEAGES